MAKRNKTTSLQKFFIIAGSLIFIEVLYLYVFSAKTQPVTVREAIHKAIAKQDELPNARKELMKVQLALADYKAKKGKLPRNLDELVPEYFDFVPKDGSGGPIKYVVTNGRYLLGDEQAKPKTTEYETDEKTDPAVLASLEADNEKASFLYDPSGKRDPFAPFDFAPKNQDTEGKSPLELYSIGQLRYTSYLSGFDEPIAIVENSAGKGYTVKKGTKIGPNGGLVTDIFADRIVVVESVIDFTGNSKTDTLELKLRTKEQENKKVK
jgi:Tfp pilus assembly protein PilP